MKIGFFGGSFNPPTKAHINLAIEALKQCGLDKLIFVPMGDEYEKQELAKAEDRLKMLEIACKSTNEKRLQVSDIELKLGKRIHAIDAFKLIQNKYKKSENFFIMGADNFINILEWKQNQELIANYKYIIFERKAIDIEKYIEENKEIKKHRENIKIIQNKRHKDTSSSEFRSTNGNRENKDIIPKEVLEYIKEKEIY